MDEDIVSVNVNARFDERRRYRFKFETPQLTGSIGHVREWYMESADLSADLRAILEELACDADGPIDEALERGTVRLPGTPDIAPPNRGFAGVRLGNGALVVSPREPMGRVDQFGDRVSSALRDGDVE